MRALSILIGWCLLVMGFAGFVGEAQQPQSSPPAKSTSDPIARAKLVGRYCIDCHSDDVKKGGLSLAANLDDIGAHPEIWEKVVRKLSARQMPPLGKPRPDEKSYDALVAVLETELDRAAAKKPNPGRTPTFRRLNRTEYQNAIRDLLALNIDAAALLPADDVSRGFDNVTVGNLSPTLLDRYISAAQKISRLAVGAAHHAPGGDTF